MGTARTGWDRGRRKGGGVEAFPFAPREEGPHNDVLDTRSAGGLRIAYLQPCDHLGGSERQAAAVIARLPEHDIDVVPVVGPTPMLCRWLEQQGVRGSILSRSFPAQREENAPWLTALRAYLRCVRQTAEQVEAIVRDGGIDVVVAGSPFAWLAATRAARRLGVPIVWRTDGTRMRPLPPGVLRLWAAMAMPDMLLHDGEASRAACGITDGVPSAVVAPGVDLDMFRSGRSDSRGLRPSGAATVVGFVGRLAPHARPEDFIKMAARLAARRSDVCFLVAGEGPSRERCEDLVRKHGLERCLRFVGFVANIPSFYAACDVVVHPSTAAACSSVLLEAMALERAVVAADVPATLEVMTPGREGLVCPPGEIESFAQTVGSLIDTPILRASLGSAAGERVRRQFDARAAAARLAAVLRRVALPRPIADATVPPAALNVS